MNGINLRADDKITIANGALWITAKNKKRFEELKKEHSEAGYKPIRFAEMFTEFENASGSTVVIQF